MTVSAIVVALEVKTQPGVFPLTLDVTLTGCPTNTYFTGALTTLFFTTVMVRIFGEGTIVPLATGTLDAVTV